MNERRGGPRGLVVPAIVAASALGACTPAKPPPFATSCTWSAEAERHALTSVDATGSLVMLESADGPTCSGTIVHRDETSAWVVSARHCLYDRHRQPVPQDTLRVLVARGREGIAWDRRSVLRVISSARHRQREWRGIAFVDDWALVQIASDDEMRAIELAEAEASEALPVALLTVRPQVRWDQPCPHARPFIWGELAQIAMAGYSGAAIIGNGRIQGVFSGVSTRGWWLMERVTHLDIAPASSIERPWIHEGVEKSSLSEKSSNFLLGTADEAPHGNPLDPESP